MKALVCHCRDCRRIVGDIVSPYRNWEMPEGKLSKFVARNRTKQRDSSTACTRCEVSRATVTRTFERTGTWHLCAPCEAHIEKWVVDKENEESAAITMCVKKGTHYPYPTDSHVSGELCGVCGMSEKGANRLAWQVEWGECKMENRPRKTT